MIALHTPNERFTGLDGWPYEPRYVTVRVTVYAYASASQR